jgi:hypothetical protein
MKLYTEEQVIALTNAAFTSGLNHNPFIFSEELKNITPIELPSDEEIDEQGNLITDLRMRSIYMLGAKWMRDKIQGGNK